MSKTSRSGLKSISVAAFKMLACVNGTAVPQHFRLWGESADQTRAHLWMHNTWQNCPLRAVGEWRRLLADALTSDAWKILPYARFSGLVIMPLPLLISRIAMKEQVSNKRCWLLIFTLLSQLEMFFTPLWLTGLFLPKTDFAFTHTLCRNVFVTYWWFVKCL